MWCFLAVGESVAYLPRRFAVRQPFTSTSVNNCYIYIHILQGGAIIFYFRVALYFLFASFLSPDRHQIHFQQIGFCLLVEGKISFL